ncbi:hypothetical protein AB1046_03400 [Promicromonospora sp. Populi]|uniref:hypothetical protein n=1 Tax=Promicromonospora sp. Populi TaxID=3239420 RepID=UPI0034E2C1C5
MTNLTDFSEDELDQILDAPGAVLKGATLADGQPGAIRFVREAASGAKVFREAQQHENAFIQSVAIALRDRLKEDERAQLEEPEEADDEAVAPAEVAASAEAPTRNERVRPDPERETARAVELTEASIALLKARADQQDVDAYAEWLVRIATKVVGATSSREGGFFSKRLAVSASEQAYIDRVTAAAAH